MRHVNLNLHQHCQDTDSDYGSIFISGSGSDCDSASIRIRDSILGRVYSDSRALDFPFVSYARLAANKSRTLTPPRHKAKVSNRERAGQIQRQDTQRGRVEGQIWSGKVWKLWDCPMTPRQTMPTIDRRLGVYVSVYISVSVSLSFSFYFSLCFRCCCCCCCCGVSVNIDVCP